MSSDLPGAPAEVGELPVRGDGCGGAKGRFPGVSALPSGECAGPGRVAGEFGDGVASHLADGRGVRGDRLRGWAEAEVVEFVVPAADEVSVHLGD